MEKNFIKRISFIIIIYIFIVIFLFGCINKENNNGNILDDNIENLIIGKWDRQDNRTFEYQENGSLIIKSAVYDYNYWFEDGYLFDTSEDINETWIYKYNITFENQGDTMILTYLGYYFDDQWYNENIKKYIFNRVF